MTEEELNEKTHIEALFSEWEFQNAEGIYTFDRDVMFKHCFEDAYKLGKKELEAQNDDIYDALNTQSLKISELEAQIEKMKCLLNEIYSEFGFSELVKIRNALPIEIQEVIKEIKEK